MISNYHNIQNTISLIHNKLSWDMVGGNFVQARFMNTKLHNKHISIILCEVNTTSRNKF